ncbi:fungal-specific transcription factor domain-containing protein [Mycena rosella]|uniref:Fungal-specific transcription factor domain-containing protein n=1 Tax=Mycena rosella TaxID=1033263 RepID=A0AAD7DYQ1_MYCRO|nr:fungal-specific transcription factor domain-containing protein [Mycena rosella]
MLSPAKKRRVQRACDICRLKKRACIGVSSALRGSTRSLPGDGVRSSATKCSNCVESGAHCTFGGAVVKRKNYIDVLESRLELTEQLLRKLSPQSEVIMNTLGSGSIQWSSDSPVFAHKNGDNAGPGVELAALTIRSMNAPPPAPHGDDLEHIALTQNLHDLSMNPRFHGKSSGAMLVKAAVQLRERYEERDMPLASRRMHYWTFNPTKYRSHHVGPYVFPEADLLPTLVDLYWANVNLYFPLLHRPTFERALADGLHFLDPSFGAVVLLVCAIGSRFSDDPRVCGPEDEPLRCGWRYFDQLPHVIDHLFVPPTVYHLQYYCLAVFFLEFSTPTPCWTLIGLGIRLAHEVGAHRARTPGSPPTVESELWKRAFWVIVCYDRTFSSMLGRPCTTQYEDFDVELPIECDDEFWENPDPAKAFKQPAGKPSQITFFNCFIRLTNILAFSLKMLYSLNKTKNLFAVRDEAWEEHIVAELDSALNAWVDLIPSHRAAIPLSSRCTTEPSPAVRWDPNREEDKSFDQSALLYCTYYQVQMTIHRPFIPMIRNGASTALPSLAICTNAARSCSHVADVSRLRKNGTPVPVLLNATFTSGLVLLLNVWSGKRTGLPPHMNSALSEVNKCMESIQVCEERWQSAALCWDLLYELAATGQLPLPPRSSPGPRTKETNGKKRPREDYDSPQDQSDASPARYPSYADTYLASVLGPTSVQLSTPPEFAALPTYTADLGRLPVFHPYAEGTSWYPSEAPLGYPDFPVSADSSNTSGSTFATGSTFSPNWRYASDLGAGADALSSDMMAMWASAPTGFEIDDWGTYFSVMSELDQGLDTADAQT